MDMRALRISLRRLGATFGARFGGLGAVVVGLLFGGAAARGEALTLETARVLCWLAAGPLALSAARAPGLRDRLDGIDVLVESRGIGARALRNSRVHAAIALGALLVSLPTALVGLTGAIVSASAAEVARAGLAVVTSAGAGATIGLVGAVSGELGGERGRSLLAAVVLVPWLVSEAWSVPSLSLVGALDAGLSLAAEVFDAWS